MTQEGIDSHNFDWQHRALTTTPPWLFQRSLFFRSRKNLKDFAPWQESIPTT